MYFNVAPLVGAWTEIMCYLVIIGIHFVAPLVGAWIEIQIVDNQAPSDGSRSSRGSVD